MKHIVRSLLSSNVHGLDPLDSTQKVARAAQPVHQKIESATAWVVDRMLAEGLDWIQPKEIERCLEEWAKDQGLDLAASSSLRPGGAAYRLDSLSITNFKGVGSAFVPITGLSSQDVIIFRGQNGQGKSTVVAALTSDHKEVQKKDNTFRPNGLLPKTGSKAVACVGLASPGAEGEWISQPDATPNFLLLGKEQRSALICPNLNTLWSEPLDMKGALAAAAGAVVLENQKKAADRLIELRANVVWSLVSGGNSLKRTAQPSPAPAQVTQAWQFWREALSNYRSLNGLSSDQPIRVDLDTWAAKLDQLVKDLGCSHKADTELFDRSHASQLLSDLQDIINTKGIPVEIQGCLDWVVQLAFAVAADLAVFQEAIRDLEQSKHQLLTYIDSRANVDPRFAITSASEKAISRIVQDALDLVNELLAALEKNEEDIKAQMAGIRDKIRAIDQKAALLREARSWLVLNPGSTDCPVCQQPAANAALASLVDNYLSQPDPLMQTLLTELASLEQRLQDIKTEKAGLGAIAWRITQLKEVHERDKSACGRARDRILTSLNILTLPPAGAGHLNLNTLPTLLQRGQVDLTAHSDEQLCSFADLTIIDAKQVEIEINQVTGGLSQAKDQLQRRLDSLKALTTVALYDQDLCGHPWANQAAQVAEDMAWNAVLDLLVKTVSDVSKDLSQELSSIQKTLVDNHRVQNVYTCILGKIQHDFMPHTLDPKDEAKLLSEGYRVAHAFAAVMAVASADTPGNDAGFIIIDEPTKCLDANLRRHLASALGKHCPKQLLVTTYDDAFADDLAQHANASGRSVAQYDLQWTATTGTTWKRR